MYVVKTLYGYYFEITSTHSHVQEPSKLQQQFGLFFLCIDQTTKKDDPTEKCTQAGAGNNSKVALYEATSAGATSTTE